MQMRGKSYTHAHPPPRPPLLPALLTGADWSAAGWMTWMTTTPIWLDTRTPTSCPVQ